MSHRNRNMARLAGVCGCTLLALAALTGCVRYKAEPIDPQRMEVEFLSRRLTSPDLERYLSETFPADGVATGTRRWDMARLTAAAFFYNPDLDVARARLLGSEAGVISAGARPNPTLSVLPEHHTDTAGGMFPWTLGFSFDIPIETARKRGYRVERARALSDAARWELAEAGWGVRSRLRSSLAVYFASRAEAALLESETAARTEVVGLLARRLELGEIAATDVDAARSELHKTEQELEGARGRVERARASLAAAIGIPTVALDGAHLEDTEFGRVPAPDALTSATLRGIGLLNRLELQRVLAEYRGAEANLELEVARQYPDVNLGPGYRWDQGDNVYSLGLSVDLPILNQNKGPIGEAEARRKEASARFGAAQAEAIRGMEAGRIAYESAWRQFAQSEAVVKSEKARFAALKQGLAAGEGDRLSVASGRVKMLSAERSRQEAFWNAQEALGRLEDALEAPLWPRGPLPALSGSSPRENLGKEAVR